MSSQSRSLLKRKAVQSTQYISVQHRHTSPERPNERLQGDFNSASDAGRPHRHVSDHIHRRKRDPREPTRSSSSPNSETNLPQQRYLPGLFAWVDHVPQSADDRSIIASVRRVFVNAEQYINNFYVDRPNRRTDLKLFVMRKAFSEFPQDYSAIDLISNVDHPTTVLKHSLVVALLSTIDLECPDFLPPLLPAEYLSLARAIRKSKPSDKDNDNDNDMPHLDAAFSTYRVLSHYIRGNVLADTSYIKQRDESVQEIIADIEEQFQPWTNEDRTREQRGPVLTALLRQTAELGILLFSQPSTFLFDWQVVVTSKARDLEVVISPRLLKVFDENAQEIGEPQQMVRVKQERTKLRKSPTTNQNSITQVRPNPKDTSLVSFTSDGPPLDAVELPAESGTSTQDVTNRFVHHHIHEDVRASAVIHEAPGETINAHARILGPTQDQPDFSHANGDGLSFAGHQAPQPLRLQIEFSHPQAASPTKSRALTGEFLVDAQSTQSRTHNGYAGPPGHCNRNSTFENNEQEHLMALERLPSYSNPNAPSIRLPPTSYPIDVANGSLSRAGSLDRGRDNFSANNHARNRSCSEPRAAQSTRSPTWPSDEMDSRTQLQPPGVVPSRTKLSIINAMPQEMRPRYKDQHDNEKRLEPSELDTVRPSINDGSRASNKFRSYSSIPESLRSKTTKQKKTDKFRNFFYGNKQQNVLVS